MPFSFYLSDFLLVVLAIAATASALPEHRLRIFKRGWLLAPGLLATAANAAMLIYPNPFDLLRSELWLLGLIGVIIGAFRARFMGMQSDQAWKLVRLDYGDDAIWISGMIAVCALMHFYIEMRIGRVNPYMTTAAFVMTLGSGYLLGRSVVGFTRARSKAHFDLRE